VRQRADRYLKIGPPKSKAADVLLGIELAGGINLQVLTEADRAAPLLAPPVIVVDEPIK